MAEGEHDPNSMWGITSRRDTKDAEVGLLVGPVMNAV